MTLAVHRIWYVDRSVQVAKAILARVHLARTHSRTSIVLVACCCVREEQASETRVCNWNTVKDNDTKGCFIQRETQYLLQFTLSKQHYYSSTSKETSKQASGLDVSLHPTRNILHCNSTWKQSLLIFVLSLSTMSYIITAISNAGGAPEQAYRKMQSAGACPDRPFAGKCRQSAGWHSVCTALAWLSFPYSLYSLFTMLFCSWFLWLSFCLLNVFHLVTASSIPLSFCWWSP
jgi:hypothetical protein